MLFFIVHLLSLVLLLSTSWTAACQVSLSFTISRSLLKLMSIEPLMPSNHLILCRSFSSCPQSFPVSGSLAVSWLLANFWKNHSFAIHTFVDKVIALLFNMLPRFVIAFLPRSKCFLISWLKSPSAVIQEPNKRKICHHFHYFPIYLP